MAFRLGDDGTMDTVIVCEDCGAEMRFNYDGGAIDQQTEDDALEDLRANYPRESASAILDMFNEQQYDAFVDSCISDCEADHECEPDDSEPSEPEEDDIQTEDHERFYQSGKLVLKRFHDPNDCYPSDQWHYLAGNRWSDLGTFAECELALKAYMARTSYFPNCWFISDHGNAHLMDLS